MIKKEKWIENYRNLSSESQLEVASAIITQYHSDESPMDKSVIKELLGFIRDEKSLKDIEKILERFEKLSERSKNQAANEIYDILEKYIKNHEQYEKEAVCKEEGHTFGKWKHNEWVDFIDVNIDHQHLRNCPIQKENWARKCSRCGYVEKVVQKPKELITAKTRKKN